MMGILQDVSKGINKTVNAGNRAEMLDAKQQRLQSNMAQLEARKNEQQMKRTAQEVKNAGNQTVAQDANKARQELMYKQAAAKQEQRKQVLDARQQAMQRDMDMAKDKIAKEPDLRSDVMDFSKPIKGPAPSPIEPTSFTPMNPSSAVGDALGSAMKGMGMKRGGNVQTTRMSSMSRSKKSSNW